MSEFDQNYQNNEEAYRPENGGQNQGAYGSSQQNGSNYSPNWQYGSQYEQYGSQYRQDGGQQYNSQPPVAQNQGGYQWSYEHYEAANQPKPKKKNKGLRVFTAILCSMALVGVLSFAGIGAYHTFSNMSETGESSSSLPANQPGNQNQEGSSGLILNDTPSSMASEPVTEGGVLTTSQIAKKVKPSVVGIVNYSASSTNSALAGFLAPSEGSGIIMSEDGYILTNAHVVANAQSLKVVLETGEEYEGRIIGSDTKTDLAVVKIEATGLPYAEFGNSTQLEVGDKVVAIGNPSGLELAGSVTQGIVSALERPVRTSDSNMIMNCIQTDAAINPGNSGGALVNEYGQVIGINSSKIADVDYEGVGFAIAINDAKPIVDDLMNHGYVTGRAKVGISYQPVDAYTAAVYQVPQGIIVVEVQPDSDVAAKGILVGDIITEIDGKAATTTQEVQEALDGKVPGDTITLTVYRRSGSSGRVFQVTISLIEDTGSAT